MPIDSIGPRQPGMIPEPEGESPDLSPAQDVKGAHFLKAPGEAAEAFPKHAADAHEGAIFPKSPESGAGRHEDAKLQGVLVRNHLQAASQQIDATRLGFHAVAGQPHAIRGAGGPEGLS